MTQVEPPLRIAIAGISGRMGQTLASGVEARDALVLVGGTERADSSALGNPAGEGVVSDRPEIATASADIWIDFTTPDASIAALDAISGRDMKAIILGTTGFSAAQDAHISALKHQFAIVKSGNFSLGVNLLAALTRQAAASLGEDWDIDILDRHHRHKVDAPSGTALLLGDAAAAGRGTALSKVKLPPFDGVTGPRPKGGIGFAVQRNGGIVGDHSVSFGSEQEMVTLSHSALDRSVFASGALHAAQWAAKQPPGLYDMQDVLGL